MNPKSHTLFHFTRNSDVLKQIIKNGFWPRYCLEDTMWLQYGDDYNYVAYPMVCFCDIPISRADEHVRFYGQYGIGLTKEWAESNRVTPILYISNNNNLKATLQHLVDNALDVEDGKHEQALENVRYLLAHTKPTEGSMVVSGSIVNKEFYQESEWRYVPRHSDIKDHLLKSEFEDLDLLKLSNTETYEKCRIEFTPKDIKYIFVKSDSDIPDMINFIQKDLDHFPSADLKILMSRVISLDSIRQDL